MCLMNELSSSSLHIYAHSILAHNQEESLFKYPKKGKEEFVPYEIFACRVKMKLKTLKKGFDVKGQGSEMTVRVKTGIDQT